MKEFLSHHYHWILLGLAALVLLVTAAILIPGTLGLRNSLAQASNIAKSTTDGLPPPLNHASDAVDLLVKTSSWSPRENGVSPFVSRPYLLKEGKLVDPLEGSEPLHPPVPNQWLVDHQLDYADVNVLDRDPKHKGFTVLEEFEAGTDPNNPTQLPPFYTKLNYSDSDIHKHIYTFDFLGLSDEENGGTNTYELRPEEVLKNPERGDKPDRSLRKVAIGETIPGAEFLKAIAYNEKKTTVQDTEYDVSELTLENTITGERHVLQTKKNHPRGYAPHPIEVIEGVTFHYQLTGNPDEPIEVKRGESFDLHSLDKSSSETYKLKEFSNEGILLEKGGETFIVKPGIPATSHDSPKTTSMSHHTTQELPV
jgi:hypothetical protein